MPETSLEGLVKELRMVANKKKTTNKGNPNPEDLFLKNQADPMTKGIIQKVLVTFKVAATSIASSPIIDAAPTTEAVSWIAKATQAPNSRSERLKKSPKIGNNRTAIAFSKKMIAMAVVNSSGLALIAGPTAAIAVPPQIAVPEPSK